MNEWFSIVIFLYPQYFVWFQTKLKMYELKSTDMMQESYHYIYTLFSYSNLIWGNINIYLLHEHNHNDFIIWITYTHKLDFNTKEW